MVNITKYGVFNLETWGIILPVLAWIGSIFTFLYCMILFMNTFTGKHQPNKLPVKDVHEAPFGMLLSPIILGALVVVLGLFPTILANTLIEPPLMAIFLGFIELGQHFIVQISHGQGFIIDS